MKKELKSFRDYGELTSIRKAFFRLYSNRFYSLLRKLKLKTGKEWYEYVKKNKLPSNIPQSPIHIYKNNGWVSMRDWLGNKLIDNYNRDFLPFNKARSFVRKLGLKNQKQWQEYSKTKRPDFIPGNPRNAYKNDGWVSLGDWLGSGSKSTSEYSFLSYKEAKKWALENNIKSGTEWLFKGSRIHNFLPSSPYKTYKDNWKGWGDFLNTGSVRTRNKVFKSFEEVKKWVIKEKIRTSQEWTAFKNKPNDIPSNPQRTYKDQWKGWADFLGKEKK